jgi:APA family basic amino acid/polyamine antiporter
MIQGGGLGAVAITFSQYTLRLIGRDFSSSRVSVAAAIAIAVVAAVNVVGVKPGSRLLNVLVVLKLGALAVLIGGGLLLHPAAPAPPVVSPPPPPASVSVLAFGTALVPILFAYGGWQSVNLLAEETTEPRRTLPRALVAGTAIVITVYLLANVVYLTVLSRPGLAATATPAAAAVAHLARGDRLIPPRSPCPPSGSST